MTSKRSSLPTKETSGKYKKHKPFNFVSNKSFFTVFRALEYIACLTQAIKIPNSHMLLPTLETKLKPQVSKFNSKEALELLRMCKQYQRSEPPHIEFPKAVIPLLPGAEMDASNLDELHSLSINYHLLKVYGDSNVAFEEMLIRGYQMRMLELWEAGPSDAIKAA